MKLCIPKSITPTNPGNEIQNFLLLNKKLSDQLHIDVNMCQIVAVLIGAVFGTASKKRLLKDILYKGIYSLSRKSIQENPLQVIS